MTFSRGTPAIDPAIRRHHGAETTRSEISDMIERPVICFPMAVAPTWAKAIEIVLRDSEQPLDCRTITDEILSRDLYRTQGQTPLNTVRYELNRHPDKFKRISGSTLYTLADGNINVRQEIDNDNWENLVNTLKRQYETEINNPGKKTEIEQLVKQRIGQNILRNYLLNSENEWNGCCPFTKIKDRDLLRVSHIKPWEDCDDNERLDPSNCILLSSLWDAAFDRALVTFDNQGKPVFSEYLCNEARIIMNCNRNIHIHINRKRERFLKLHRQKFYEKEEERNRI